MFQDYVGKLIFFYSFMDIYSTIKFPNTRILLLLLLELIIY